MVDTQYISSACELRAACTVTRSALQPTTEEEAGKVNLKQELWQKRRDWNNVSGQHSLKTAWESASISTLGDHSTAMPTHHHVLSWIYLQLHGYGCIHIRTCRLAGITWPTMYVLSQCFLHLHWYRGISRLQYIPIALFYDLLCSQWSGVVS